MAREALAFLLALGLVLVGVHLAPHQLPADPVERAAVLDEWRCPAEALSAYEAAVQAHPSDVRLLRKLLDFGGAGPSTPYSEGYVRLATDPGGALTCFDSVRDKRMPFLNHSIGVARAALGQDPTSAWRQEVEVKEAVRSLGNWYREHGDLAGLRGLCDDPVTGPFVSERNRAWVAWQQGAWLTYVGLAVGNAVGAVTLPAALSALAIAGMWLVYFRRLKPLPLGPVALVFTLGALGNLLLSLLLQEVAGTLDPRPYDLSDPIFAVFHIALTEEALKFLPLILLARRMNEPLDYVIYGCMSALGFAVVECAVHYGDGILARFTASVPCHLAWTGLVAYAWARKPMAVPAAFMLAVGWHGAYDVLTTGPWSAALALPATLLLGRLLADALDPSRSAPTGLQNMALFVGTAMLLLTIRYLDWNFTVSTALADRWLASQAFGLAWVPVYFATLAWLRVPQVWPGGAAARPGATSLVDRFRRHVPESG